MNRNSRGGGGGGGDKNTGWKFSENLISEGGDFYSGLESRSLFNEPGV